MIFKRRKGVAIVDTKKGILVVATEKNRFMLPGGGAERWESRKKAAIRELYEETNLKAKKIKYLFRSESPKWYNKNGRLTKNYSKVFLIEAEGEPIPKNEIRYLDFWKEGSKLNILEGSEKIINRYLSEHKNESINST